MIRQANKFDIDNIIEILKHYRDADPLQTIKNANDREYIVQLLTNIISGMGFILLAEKDNKIAGMVMAAVIPNIWNPHANELHELVYWVEPEFRGGTIGYRLLKQYIEIGEKFKEEKRIEFFTISKMVNSPDIKYNKFGFNKLEETWIK